MDKKNKGVYYVEENAIFVDNTFGKFYVDCLWRKQ
jgi:hypothetical protein